jgi:hypothetical protein
MFGKSLVTDSLSFNSRQWDTVGTIEVHLGDMRISASARSIGPCAVSRKNSVFSTRFDKIRNALLRIFTVSSVPIHPSESHLRIFVKVTFAKGNVVFVIMKRFKKIGLILVCIGLLAQLPFAYHRYQIGALAQRISTMRAAAVPQDEGRFKDYPGGTSCSHLARWTQHRDD